MIYLTTKDIMKITSVGKQRAMQMKREVNDYTESLGYHLTSGRTCLASMFTKVYGVTQEEIERRLSE